MVDYREYKIGVVFISVWRTIWRVIRPRPIRLEVEPCNYLNARRIGRLNDAISLGPVEDPTCRFDEPPLKQRLLPLEPSVGNFLEISLRRRWLIPDKDIHSVLGPRPRRHRG